MKKQIPKWKPDKFEMENNTIWSFPDRGEWATHDGTYRGNWSPYIARNLLLRYSASGDLVLDQFAGGGTTLIEAKLLNRNIIGIDVNPMALQICKEKCSFQYNSDSKIYIKLGDARNINFIPDRSIDFICTHPPYADIIKYSADIEADMSHLNEKDFLLAIVQVAEESFRVLKKHKYCAVLMGDIRKKGYIVPLGFQVMQRFQDAGFALKEVIIKEQHNCKSTATWKSKSQTYNFLLLAHEYLFVFEKR